jgi:hypothetical protein
VRKVCVGKDLCHRSVSVVPAGIRTAGFVVRPSLIYISCTVRRILFKQIYPSRKMDLCPPLTCCLCAALSDSVCRGVRGNGSPSEVQRRISDIGLHRLELSDCETKPCTSQVAVTVDAIFSLVTASSGSAMQLQFFEKQQQISKQSEITKTW